MKNSKVCGVGINDSKNTITKYNKTNDKIIWKCPYYSRWTDMLNRCYNQKVHKIKPTYKDCFVCEEWLTFSNFKSWMEQQDWEGKELDKDILGDGKLYSPDTCCFVPHEINSVITDSLRSRGKYPVGVTKHKRTGMFFARISMKKKLVHLGQFTDPDQASICYKYWKSVYLRQLSYEYSDQINEKLKNALDNWTV